MSRNIIFAPKKCSIGILAREFLIQSHFDKEEKKRGRRLVEKRTSHTFIEYRTWLSLYVTHK
jgi:hypothetical protein